MIHSHLLPDERFRRMLRKEEFDRAAWALWNHDPLDEYTPHFARNHAAKLRSANYDLWKISFRSSYQIRDYGTEDEFGGDFLGRPRYLNKAVQNVGDWKRLAPLSPAEGMLARCLEDVKFISSAAPRGHPVCLSIWSPMSQAANLCGGWECLAEHWKADAASVQYGLEVLAESTVRWTRSLPAGQIDGIFYICQECCQPSVWSTELKEVFLNLDSVILGAKEHWLNVIHLHGAVIEAEAYRHHPAAIFHLDEVAIATPLESIAKRFPGIISGGLDWPVNGWGSAELAKQAAESAMKRFTGVNFMLSAGCVIPYDSALAEISATRPWLSP